MALSCMVAFTIPLRGSNKRSISLLYGMKGTGTKPLLYQLECFFLPPTEAGKACTRITKISFVAWAELMAGSQGFSMSQVSARSARKAA